MLVKVIRNKAIRKKICFCWTEYTALQTDETNKNLIYAAGAIQCKGSLHSQINCLNALNSKAKPANVPGCCANGYTVHQHNHTYNLLQPHESASLNLCTFLNYFYLLKWFRLSLL